MNDDHGAGIAAGQNHDANKNPRKNPPRTRPWFEDCLPFEYRGSKAPEKIIITRNLAMIALSIQVASTVAGFAFYFIRESAAYLVANGISIITLANGWWGVLYLSRWNTAIHGVLTSGILGVFFLYSMIEALIRNDLTTGKNERTTYMLLALPYFVDLLAGLVTFYFSFLLFREEEERQAKRERDEPDLLLPEDYDESRQDCCVCMNKKAHTWLYPCGHSVLCFECGQEVLKRQNKKCPICRRPIQGIAPRYD